MYALLTLVLAHATALPAIKSPSPHQDRVVAEQSETLPVPMDARAWNAMTATQRMRYADVTIQGLRRNTVFAQCEALTPARLITLIDRSTRPGEPLMMAIANAALTLCR